MRRLALAALSALTLVACSNSSTAPSTIVGTYNLQTINGQPLPVTVSGSTTVQAETATLNNDGTYTFITQYNNGTGTERGIYSSNGGAIYFTPDAGASYQGSISGQVLTVISNGYTSVYQHQ